MTRLCLNRMGCGQSIRKKSKHKSSAKNDNSNYNRGRSNDVESDETAVPSSSLRPPGYDPLTPTSTEEMDNLLAKSSGSLRTPQSSSGAIRSKGGGTDANGEPSWKSKAPFGESDKSAAPFIHKGPLSSQLKVSNSQAEFFKMLEDKIEKGPDYVTQDGT